MNEEIKKLIDNYNGNLESPFTEEESNEIESAIKGLKDILPLQECGHDRGGCPCGLVWSLKVDYPVLSSDTRDPDMQGPSLEQIILMARYTRIAMNYFPRLYNLLKSKEK